MDSLITDELASKISITRSYKDWPGRLVLVSGPEEIRILTETLGAFTMNEIPAVAFCVLQRRGFEESGMGFRYEPGPFEGQQNHKPRVTAFSPYGELLVGLEVFERLILRYFHEIIACAVQVRHLALQLPSWIKFEGAVSEIKKRLEKGG